MLWYDANRELPPPRCMVLVRERIETGTFTGIATMDPERGWVTQTENGDRFACHVHQWGRFADVDKMPALELLRRPRERVEALVMAYRSIRLYDPTEPIAPGNIEGLKLTLDTSTYENCVRITTIGPGAVAPLIHAADLVSALYTLFKKANA